MTSFDCTDIKATLSGLIDDQIDADTRHLAERHLSQCAACRTLVSQAESLDDLIAMDAAAFAPKRLPDGFVDSVLDRTVYARIYHQAATNWITWTGWVAAAACVLLASMNLVLSRRSTQGLDPNYIAGSPSNGAREPGVRPMIASDDPGMRSWTYDNALDRGAIFASNFTLDEATRTAIDAQLEQTLPSPAARDEVGRSAVSEEDSDTLHAAAILLDILADSDLRDFADIERMREIAVYDELPQRLADVRTRLRPTDRATVMAAESVLLRIVNGPIDMSDARLLRDSVASLKLAAQIGGIGAGRDAATSM